MNGTEIIYSNLPAGTKVKLTSKTRALLAKKRLYVVNDVTIVAQEEKGYLVKELVGTHIKLSDIESIITYPINEADLIPGKYVKVRSDLSDFTCSMMSEWGVVGEKHKGQAGKLIKAGTVVYLAFDGDVRSYWATHDMLECVLS